MIEDNIISAIEKLSGVLKFLHWDISKREKLTPLQIQCLIYLNSRNKSQRKVTIIAKEFNISKATISSAINILIKKKLAGANIPSVDRRIKIIYLTYQGEKMLKKFAGMHLQIKKQLEKFSYETKEKAMLFLMELIVSLKDTGLMQIARLCLNCENFSKDIYPETDKPHYCKLLNKRRAAEDLRFDCDRYVPAVRTVFN